MHSVLFGLQSPVMTKCAMSTRKRYPYLFTCDGCDAETVVTRSQAATACSDPDQPMAPASTLVRVHSWEKTVRGVCCPDCATVSV